MIIAMGQAIFKRIKGIRYLAALKPPYTFKLLNTSNISNP